VTNKTWGKVKQSIYFLVKHVLKYVSLQNKKTVSLCPMFHSSPLPPTFFCHPSVSVIPKFSGIVPRDLKF
jgi:hypothetical protein